MHLQKIERGKSDLQSFALLAEQRIVSTTMQSSKFDHADRVRRKQFGFFFDDQSWRAGIDDERADALALSFPGLSMRRPRKNPRFPRWK